MVNVLKFQTLFSFCSQMNSLFPGLEFTKWLSKEQTGKIMIRLLILACAVCLGFFGKQPVFEILEYLP